MHLGLESSHVYAHIGGFRFSEGDQNEEEYAESLLRMGLIRILEYAERCNPAVIYSVLDLPSSM